MPVLSAKRVSVKPVTARSSLSLEEIAELMRTTPPSLAGKVGGWASSDDYRSNLGRLNVEPPPSSPTVMPDTGSRPKTLAARFYFWERPPGPDIRELARVPSDELRKLDAVDLLITEAGGDLLSILISTRNLQMLKARGGALKALEGLLQRDDAMNQVDVGSSLVALASDEIFLWAAARVAQSPQVDANTRLDAILGLSDTDAASRATELRSGVDFARPNFLTAVAESNTFGPMSLSVVDDSGGRHSSFAFQLFQDGGFSFAVNDVMIEGLEPEDPLMVIASHHLAYELIPRLNRLFTQDQEWPSMRTSVIRDAMDVLAARYTALRARLN